METNEQNKGGAPGVAEATSQEESRAAVRVEIARLMNEYRERTNAYIPVFSLTDEYQAEANKDTAAMSERERDEHVKALLSLKMGGGYAPLREQAISDSLNMPLAEIVANRDKYRAEVEKLEDEIDNYSEHEYKNAVERLGIVYQQKIDRAQDPMARRQLAAEANKEEERLYFENVTLPKNNLALDRYKAEILYNVYEGRLAVFVKENKDIIQAEVDRVRAEEVRASLADLVPYIESEEG